MTAIGTLADPDCGVCHGTGTDPVFFGDCTECWPHQRQRDREELWHARRQAAMLPPPPTEPVRICMDCDMPSRQDRHGRYERRCELHHWMHEADGWAAVTPATETSRMWAANARRRLALLPQRTPPRQPSH